MAANGPGELTSIAFGATSVNANLIHDFSVGNEKDAYDAALGISFDRGSIRKTLSCNVLDYSAFAAIQTLMTGRTESTVTVTYKDAATLALAECILRITPLVQQVTDVCNVYAAAAGTSTDSLATGWTDLGGTIGLPTMTFDFPFDGQDGKGRPYWSLCRAQSEFMLPGDVYSDLTSLGHGSGVRLAFKLPDGTFQVLDNQYLFFQYGDQDASQPRVVSVRTQGVATTFISGLLFWSDGAATANDAVGGSDYFHGGRVECVGFDYSEANMVTWG